MMYKPDEQPSTVPPVETKDEPAAETATEAEQASDQEPIGKMRSLFEGFKSRADKFVREHFKGEFVEQPVGSKTKEISKAVGSGLLGAAASIGGLKSFADVPRWFLQKYYTKQEQKRIKDAMNFASADESIDGKMDVGDEVLYVDQDGNTETGWVIVDKSKDGMNASIRKGDNERHIGMGVSINELLPTKHPSPLEQKKQRLEKAINESKYLAPEKKQELLNKLQDTVETYEDEIENLETEQNEKVAKLLDEAIQTRVKGTTALKEALNTALIGTGLATLRGLGYGAVALYERGIKVTQEMEKGERTENFAKELVVNGFKETWKKLRMKEGETTIKKAANFGQAVGTVMRFAGFAGLAVGEWTGKGGISDALEKAMDAMEQKGVAQTASDNYGAQFDRVLSIVTLGKFGGAEGEAGAVKTEEIDVAKAETQAVAAETGTVVAEDGTPAVATEAKTAEAEMAEPDTTAEVPADAETPEETTPERAELSKDEIEAGTVRKGDGIIRIVQRQLKLDPKKYGYDGDSDDKKTLASWVRKTAFAATKQAGFVNQDGWMGVSGKAIDHMALGVRSEGGELKLDFYDAKTGETMSLDDLQEKKFIYDYQKPEEYEEFEPESDYKLFEDEPVAEAEPVAEGASAKGDATAPIKDAENAVVEEELPRKDKTGDESVVSASGSSVEAPVDGGTEEEAGNAQKRFEAARAEKIAQEAAEPEPEAATPDVEMDSREPINIGKETVSFKYDAAGKILAPQSLLQYGALDETRLFDKIGTDRNIMDRLATAHAAETPNTFSLYKANANLKFERLLKAQYTIEQMRKLKLQVQHPKALAFLKKYVTETIQNLEKAKERYGIK